MTPPIVRTTIAFHSRPNPSKNHDAPPDLIIGEWPDGFVAIIQSMAEVLEDPYSRQELVDQFEELRRSY